ncbi:hypothetical protein EG327_002479 [Venturia inaequalis]|uniref:Cellophane-induced protein 1-like 2 n=1 Tax=Venturia inaequalis TaxID=5025 RepID=A0A8H3VLE5_VENIN|nr:hypothetical protein EG327_002479 [Venturia inaequalis]
MRFAAIISMAFATFSMTSAMALPNEATFEVGRDDPKKTDKLPVGTGAQGVGPVNGDLHHVKTSYCKGLTDAKKRSPCLKALEACEKEKSEPKEEACQDKVKKNYHN